MDQSEQAGNAHHPIGEELAAKRMERAVLGGCVFIGIIGVAILLMVATHAQGGAVGPQLG